MSGCDNVASDPHLSATSHRFNDCLEGDVSVSVNTEGIHVLNDVISLHFPWKITALRVGTLYQVCSLQTRGSTRLAVSCRAYEIRYTFRRYPEWVFPRPEWFLIARWPSERSRGG